MKGTRRSGHPPESYPRIFISHRHKDKDVAQALVNVLEAAFHLKKEDIRCTSVQPYTLEGGDRTPDRLRAEISQARVVLGILTPDTKESSYVLFELGASWGQEVRSVPLLAKGATWADIPSPISDLHPLQLADERDCQQLIKEIPNLAGLRHHKGFEPQVAEKMRALVRRAGRAKGTLRLAKSLAIKITEPAPGQAVSGRNFSVEGRFEKRLPSGTFRVFITNIDRTKIWPQKRVVFHSGTHTWQAKATLLDHPAHEAYILIAEIGDMGKLLYDYYTEVGEARDVWIPLSKFTPDTTIYDEVYVRNRMTSGGSS
jgi:TIR domain